MKFETHGHLQAEDLSKISMMGNVGSSVCGVTLWSKDRNISASAALILITPNSTGMRYLFHILFKHKHTVTGKKTCRVSLPGLCLLLRGLEGLHQYCALK